MTLKLDKSNVGEFSIKRDGNFLYCMYDSKRACDSSCMAFKVVLTKRNGTVIKFKCMPQKNELEFDENNLPII